MAKPQVQSEVRYGGYAPSRRPTLLVSASLSSSESERRFPALEREICRLITAQIARRLRMHTRVKSVLSESGHGNANSTLSESAGALSAGERVSSSVTVGMRPIVLGQSVITYARSRTHTRLHAYSTFAPKRLGARTHGSSLRSHSVEF